MKKDFTPTIKSIFEKLGFKRMEYVREPKTKKTDKML